VELDFASDLIGKRIVQSEARRDYNKLTNHYEYVHRRAWEGAYCGHLWEYLCHAIIPLGTKKWFELEPLTNGVKNRRIVPFAVTTEKGKLENMMDALQEGSYFQPSASNFSVHDAMVMEKDDIFGFQMTVTSSHPPKAHEAIKLLNAIPAGKKLHLMWVVDGARPDSIKTAQCF
jgi:hypothetical protein